MEYVQIDASSVWSALFSNKRLDCSHIRWNIYWRLPGRERGWNCALGGFRGERGWTKRSLLIRQRKGKRKIKRLSPLPCASYPFANTQLPSILTSFRQETNATSIISITLFSHFLQPLRRRTISFSERKEFGRIRLVSPPNREQEITILLGMNHTN